MRKQASFCLLTCMVILLVFGATAHAEPQLYSIQELREVTSPVWRQTYQAYGRTIEVNKEVYIPQVDAAPVIMVSLMPPLPDVQRNELAAWYANAAKTDLSRVYDFRSDDFNTVICHAIYPEWGERSDSEFIYGEMSWGAHGVFDYDMDAAYAEDNTLTVAEAFDIAQKRLKEFYPDQEVFLRNVAVYDRSFWKKTKEPISKKGHYWLECTQVFHGIPLMANIYSAILNRRPLKNELYWRNGFGTLIAEVYDAGAYNLTCNFFKEIDVLYADIPLLSFDAVRDKVEDLILAGYVRYVDRVALGYVQYDTQESNEMILVPSWVIWCEYVKDGPREEPHEALYTQGAFVEGDTYFPIIINAQTGELMTIEPENDDSKRCQCPAILEW